MLESLNSIILVIFSYLTSRETEEYEKFLKDIVSFSARTFSYVPNRTQDTLSQKIIQFFKTFAAFSSSMLTKKVVSRNIFLDT